VVPDPSTGEREVLTDRHDDGVLIITLNRPEQRNAWTVSMEAQYFAALAAAADDPGVRAVVVTGSGGHFCPGFDAARLSQVAGGVTVELGDRPTVAEIRRFPKPMIAAINGACAGIGLVHALLCDVRFVAEDARVATAFTRRGLAGERAVTWLLPRLVGVERALDLLLSGRTVSGAEAHALGLASRAGPATEVLDAAITYAGELARRSSPIAMAVMREQVWSDLDRTFAASSEVSDTVMIALSAGPDLAESVRAAEAGEKPAFPPLAAGFDAAGWIVDRSGPRSQPTR
jgi:enoyl-CoA hydratase/carnithine racemase